MSPAAVASVDVNSVTLLQKFQLTNASHHYPTPHSDHSTQVLKVHSDDRHAIVALNLCVTHSAGTLFLQVCLQRVAVHNKVHNIRYQ